MINHWKPYKMIRKSRVKIFFVTSRYFIISHLHEPDFHKYINKYISSYTYK